MRLSRRAVSLVALLLLALPFGCGDDESGAQSPSIRFDEPPRGFSLEVQTGEEAAARLGFVPLSPPGTPVAIYVYPANQDVRHVGAIAYDFEDPERGTYRVIEELSEISSEDLLRDLESVAADCAAAADCDVKYSVAEIRGGLRAALGESPELTSIRWVEKDLMVTIYGLPDALTGEDAIAVANSIEQTALETQLKASA